MTGPRLCSRIGSGMGVEHFAHPHVAEMGKKFGAADLPFVHRRFLVRRGMGGDDHVRHRRVQRFERCLNGSCSCVRDLCDRSSEARSVHFFVSEVLDQALVVQRHGGFGDAESAASVCP